MNAKTPLMLMKKHKKNNKKQTKKKKKERKGTKTKPCKKHFKVTDRYIENVLCAWYFYLCRKKKVKNDHLDEVTWTDVSTSRVDVPLILMKACAKIVKTLVHVISNSPSHDYTGMKAELKPLIVFCYM